jgi:hypothetical protein
VSMYADNDGDEGGSMYADKDGEESGSMYGDKRQRRMWVDVR